LSHVIFSEHSNYKKRLVSLLFILFFIPTLSFGALQYSMRGEQYCEIVLSKTGTEFVSYNTMGLNECPIDIWKKITVAQVKEDTGSSFVRLNGPRHWIMDSYKNAAVVNTAVKSFNGLSMREIGEYRVNSQQVFISSIPYQTGEVKRQITWIYDAGKPVYELIDSKGHVFVMHSYSSQKVLQTEDSLSI